MISIKAIIKIEAEESYDLIDNPDPVKKIKSFPVQIIIPQKEDEQAKGLEIEKD